MAIEIGIMDTHPGDQETDCTQNLVSSLNPPSTSSSLPLHSRTLSSWQDTHPQGPVILSTAYVTPRFNLALADFNRNFKYTSLSVFSTGDIYATYTSLHH